MGMTATTMEMTMMPKGETMQGRRRVIVIGNASAVVNRGDRRRGGKNPGQNTNCGRNQGWNTGRNPRRDLQRDLRRDLRRDHRRNQNNNISPTLELGDDVDGAMLGYSDDILSLLLAGSGGGAGLSGPTMPPSPSLTG